MRHICPSAGLDDALAACELLTGAHNYICTAVHQKDHAEYTKYNRNHHEAIVYTIAQTQSQS